MKKRICLFLVILLLVFSLFACGTKFKVSFDTDGGTPIESVEVSKNKPIAMPDSPRKEGYTFKGWYIGNEAFDQSSYLVDGDVTLKALWEANEYVITCEYGYDDLRETQIIKYDSPLTLKEVTRVGYTFKGWLLDNELFEASVYQLAKDITLVASWEADEYEISYDVNGGNDLDEASDKVLFDSNITLPIPTRDGYTFDGWMLGSDKYSEEVYKIADDITLVANWLANTDTKYTVNYYLEDLNSDEYSLKESVTLTGTTDTLTNAEVKSFEGFAAPEVTQVNINGDESTVIDLYYTRNSFELKLTVNNERAGTISGSGTYEYEEEVTLEAIINPGYTFIGWYNCEELISNASTYKFNMLASDLEYFGKYEANTDTKYIVNYYLENLNSDEYSLKESATLTGTTDTLTNAEAKVYEGFTTPDITQVNINGDESTVIDLYYKRNSYEFKLTINNEKGGSVTGLGTYEFEGEVTLDATINPGYTFIGWFNGEEMVSNASTYKFNMVASNLEYVGKYEANTDTKYVVNYYLENLSDTEYTLKETVTLTGTTDTLTNAESKIFEGFTTPTITQVSINGDESTVINLYYKRNSYTLSLKVSNEKSGSVTGSGTYKYEEEVTIDVLVNPGYTFNEWVNINNVLLTTSTTYKFNMIASDLEYTAKISANTNTKYVINYCQELVYSSDYTIVEIVELTGTTDTLTNAETKVYEGMTVVEFEQVNINGDGSTVLNIYYTRNVYELKINVDSSKGGEVIGARSYKYYEVITIISRANPGYTFKGIYNGEELVSEELTYTFFMPSNDLEYIVKFEANTDTPYTVNYYQENLDGENYTLVDTVNLTGTTDTLTSAEAKQYVGFTTPVIEQVNINGDGSTVLNVYYNRNTYTITLLVNNDQAGNVIGSGTYKYQEEVTIQANRLDYLYAFDGWYKNDELVSTDINYKFNVSEDLSLVAKYSQVQGLEPFTYVSDSTKLEVTGLVDTTMANVTIPNGVTSIGARAFYNLKTLESITIPDSVENIGERAFYNCKGLTEISLPKQLKTVKNEAFYYCTNITKVNIKDLDGYINVTFSGKESSPLYYAHNLYLNDDLLTDLIIPNGVTALKSYTFTYCKSLLTVSIPESVQKISNTFVECENLNKVYITSIESWANIEMDNGDYNPLYYAHNLYLNNELVTNLVIPNTVTTIKFAAFIGCTSLTSVSIPNSVTKIAGRIFEKCSNLTSVEIPNSISIIEWSMFNGCTSLDNVVLPDSIKTISNSAFAGCKALKSIVIPSTVSVISDNAFSECISLNNIILPDGITRIGRQLFYMCESITSITIPDSVTNIGVNAFRGCTGLTSIVIPDSVLTIDGDAFRDCSNLVSITLPKDIEKISDSMFDGCSSLESIEIPSDVISIGSYAFKDCISLKSFEIPTDVTEIKEFTFYGCSSLENIAIHEFVTSIGMEAFSYCTSLNNIVIPDSITSIGYHAFYNCSGLTSVKIPGSVTNLGTSIFDNCENLTEVELEEGLTTIAGGMFTWCKNIRTIIIPKSIVSIESGSFFYCDKISAIFYKGSESEWNNIQIVDPGYGNFLTAEIIFDAEIESVKTIENEKYSYVLLNNKYVYSFKISEENKDITSFDFETELNGYIIKSLAVYAFYQCTRLVNISIPNGVERIGSYAFWGCTNLLCVVISEGIKVIENSCFWECNNLLTISLPSTIDKIDNNAFYRCRELKMIIYNGTDENWNNIQIESQEQSSFSKTPIWFNKTVEALSFIKEEQFQYLLIDNIYVYYFKITSAKDTIESFDFNTRLNGYVIKSFEKSAFNGCTNLKSIVIPDSVEDINATTFYGCTSLESVQLPNGIKEIGNYSFGNCSALTNIIIPDSVENIGNGAFDCSALTSIIIPNSVKSIGDNAFSSCSSLQTITVPNIVAYIGKRAFYCCTGLQSVVIPRSVETVGEYAFLSCNGSIIHIYCEADAKPDGWDDNWNYNNYSVTWGYQA